MHDLMHNRILIITCLVWVITQMMKVAVGVIQERRFNFRWFIGTGGIPSSHAAGVMALATTIGLQEGVHSAVFALAAVFALVTMFDAQGVRRATGQQAEVLNKILDDIYWRGRINAGRLKEFIGHTPFQVFVGAVVGFVLSWTMYHQWNAFSIAPSG